MRWLHVMVVMACGWWPGATGAEEGGLFGGLARGLRRGLAGGLL